MVDTGIIRGLLGARARATQELQLLPDMPPKAEGRGKLPGPLSPKLQSPPMLLTSKAYLELVVKRAQEPQLTTVRQHRQGVGLRATAKEPVQPSTRKSFINGFVDRLKRNSYHKSHTKTFLLGSLKEECTRLKW